MGKLFLYFSDGASSKTFLDCLFGMKDFTVHAK